MEKLTPQKIEQMKEMIKDIDFNPVNQSLIKDNKLIFIYNDKVYRCRMPNQRIQSEAETEQNRTRISMYKRDDTITRKQLIAVLKEKHDIDISKLEKQKEQIGKELFDVMIDIANTLSDEQEKLRELKATKKEIESKMLDITIEIVEYLAPSIEEQCKQAFYGYLAYACTEKNTDRENDVWESVWKNYEDYKNDEDGLSIVALQKIQSLILHLSEQ